MSFWKCPSPALLFPVSQQLLAADSSVQTSPCNSREREDRVESSLDLHQSNILYTRIHAHIYIYIYLLKNVKDIVILRLPLILLDFISPRSEYSTEELDRFNSTQVPTTDFAMTLCKLWISFVASFLQSLDCIGRRLCCFLEVALKLETQGYRRNSANTSIPSGNRVI